LALAIFRDLARLRLVGNHREAVASLRGSLQAEELDRHRRTGFLDLAALVVDQRAHAAPFVAGDQNVALAQGAGLDEHGRHRTASAVELGLDDHAFGGTVRIGLQLEQLGLQQDRLEELVDIEPLERRYLDLQDVAAHGLDKDLVLEQLGTYLLRIGLRLVDLVDGNDDRNTG